jgi:hypothetical protein
VFVLISVAVYQNDGVVRVADLCLRSGRRRGSCVVFVRDARRRIPIGSFIEIHRDRRCRTG